MAQAILHGIDAEVRGNFVDQRFARKTATDVARRAQIAGAQRNRFRKVPIDVLGNDLLIVDAVDFSAALRAVR